MESEKEFVDNIVRLDRSSFDLVNGLRAGLFVVCPFLLAPVIGYVGAAYAVLNGMWLTNTDGPRSREAVPVLLVACFAESAATGLGTLAGSAGAITPLLVGVGVFLPMLLHGNPRWNRVGTYTAITFAVGVGIPGNLDAAVLRTAFSLLGTLWVLLGIVAWRRFGGRLSRAGRERATSSGGPGADASELHPDALRNALTLGAASAVGIWVGLVLGLPRDFWVAVTIILTVQPSFNSTLTFTSSMVMGTVLGAVVGAAAAAYAPGVYAQLLLLAAFAVLMFATRGVNLALLQVFLAPFVIVLLDLIYGRGVNFPEARVIDVAIGGLISVVTVYVLGLGFIRRYWKRPASARASRPPAAEDAVGL